MNIHNLLKLSAVTLTTLLSQDVARANGLFLEGRPGMVAVGPQEATPAADLIQRLSSSVDPRYVNLLGVMGGHCLRTKG